jgi:hypothetical protein
MTVILEGLLSIIHSIGELFNKVWDFFAGIPDFIKRFFEWLVPFIKQVPITLLNDFLSFIADILNTILSPLSSFLAVFLDYSSLVTYSSTFAYFIAPFRVGYGLGIIITAYSVRFLIRRIPFIG